MSPARESDVARRRRLKTSRRVSRVLHQVLELDGHQRRDLRLTLARPPKAIVDRRGKVAVLVGVVGPGVEQDPSCREVLVRVAAPVLVPMGGLDFDNLFDA